ncbi:MAG: archaeal flagellar protein FlaI [Thermoplasmata archaeon]|jgi:flagellar protein FlaI|nr:archaeal flagellar protein FlaI [Thermoplasmata archaeon]
MPSIVPVLEFVHALNSAGIAADFASVVASPQEQWDRLPADRREAFLVEHGAEGSSDKVKRVVAVKRRGRADSVDNVFVMIEFAGRGIFSRSKANVMFRAYAPAKAMQAAEELTMPPDAFLGIEGGPRRLMNVLDAAWGGEPYDAARDGAITTYAAPREYKEKERYWLEEPFSMAVILEGEDHELLYHVQEPPLTGLEDALLVTLNDRLRDVLILQDEGEAGRAEFLLTKVFELLNMYRLRTDRRTAYKLGYTFLRNYLGLGRIEPIMHDVHVEDISCNGPGLPVFVAHNVHQSMRTNLAFGEMELNSFTMKLAQRGGKLLSIAQPLVDASLPNGSRIQAVLGHEVTSRGSAFTIRKFREDPLTAVDLIKSGTHSVDTMATLWMAVEMRRSMIVMGATASGKTTTLNALSQFIPPALKIVSIEDTREITLKHDNWLAAITRESFTGPSGDRVSMFDLLKAALRQRPDYLVVGEIRGVEGLTLFQAMSTGHTCFSTMHAGSVENAVYRLENPPINVPRVMLTSLDFFVTQGQVNKDGHPARRMLSLTEINGIDPQTRNLRINELFKWDAAKDEQTTIAQSQVFERARSKGGWTRARMDEEFASRRRVLERLVSRNERHYHDVAKAVRQFYTDRAEPAEWVPGPVFTSPEAPAFPARTLDDLLPAKKPAKSS